MERQRPALKRSGIPVPVSSQRSDDSGVTEVDGSSDSVSIKSVASTFGGEAKIRRLPTPVINASHLSAAKITQEQSHNQTRVEVNYYDDISRAVPHYPTNMDYPICGTISPLTDHIQIKRSVGPVDEVSFVFGRPTSPSSDTGLRRCISPPQLDKRPMSPATDIVPAKKPQSSYYRRFVQPTVEEEKLLHGGVFCEHCNSCLIDLKRQALRLMHSEYGRGGIFPKGPEVSKIEERLHVPETSKKFLKKDHCDVCDTHIRQLKQEAVAMVHSIQQAQTESAVSTNIPALVGSCNFVPSQRNNSNSSGNHTRFNRQGKAVHTSNANYIHTSAPIAAQAQAYLEQNVRAWINPKKYNQMHSSRLVGQERIYSVPEMPGSDGQFARTPTHYTNSNLQYITPPYMQQSAMQPQYASPPPSISRISSPGSPTASPSAAASFFARAAQKLSKKKKRHQPPEPEPPPFPTKFGEVIRLSPPPVPPCLLRAAGRTQTPGVGKVKVMLRICNTGHQGDQGSTFLNVDPRKKQVTVYDPSSSGYTISAHRRSGAVAPKMFAFDAVFSPDDSLTELCSSSLTEIVQGVVNGADGCLFTYGYSKLGKSFTMTGKDHSSQTLGFIPCAISWLFRLINEHKEKTGARFSVRVSAIEVSGKQEKLRDLLSDVAQGTETGVATAPGVYLREDPICGTQLENQSELRAPSAEKAAYYLDAALAARAAADEEECRSSHLLFTLHVYQYRIEKANTKAGLPGVAGGRSRLHLIDLGSSSKSKDPNNVSLSLSALGNVIMALLNGQRHVPHRDTKIAQLLRDSLGNITCRTCMIAHVSSAIPHYNETLQVIQLAARIHRMRRRKTKFSSTSSDDSSTDDGRLKRPFRGFRMGTLREDVLYSSSHSDPDYTSSSEQSCDTVIYVGANGQSLSDREFTDNEGPPRSVPRTNPRLPRRTSGSRSSGDEGSHSDSGRSAHSDFRFRPNLSKSSLSPQRVPTPVRETSMSPQRMHTPVRELGHFSNEHASSPPMSPSPGIVQLPRRMNIWTKTPSCDESASQSFVNCGRSDKMPHQGHAVRPNAEHANMPHHGEQWVDGPGAAIYPQPQKAEEMWIDGPQAFIMKKEQPKQESVKHIFNAKINAEEKWVDGPREMIVGQEGRMDRGSSPGKSPHHVANSRMERKQQYRDPTTESKVPPAHQTKSLKQSPKHLSLNVKDRPESTVSVDSISSTKANAADSRPVSMHSGVPETEPVLLLEQPQDVKPFVRDWIERHSSHTTSDQPNQIVNSDNQIIGTIESHRKPKSHDLRAKRLPSTSTPKQSPHHSPKNSPATSRKCKTEAAKFQKSQLPVQAHPTNRVTEWLKSVTVEQGIQNYSPIKNNSTVTNEGINMGSYEGFGASANETASHNVSSCSSVQPESVTETDSVLQQSTDREVVSESLPDIVEFNIADVSFDSSVDTNELNGLLLSNRESIYEIQVEEQLENGKLSQCKALSDIADDETFSNHSCSNNNDTFDGEQDEETVAEKKAVLSYECDNCDTKVQCFQAGLSNCESHYQGHKLKLCNFDRKDTSSPAISEYDNDCNTEITRLLRKPDGASNPNLLKEQYDEVKLDYQMFKSDFISNSYSSPLYQACSELDRKGMGLATTSAVCTVYSVPNYELTENDSPEITYSVNSKPPLPQKPSSSKSPKICLKQNSKSQNRDVSFNSNLNGTRTTVSNKGLSLHGSNGKEKDRKDKTPRSHSQQPNANLSPSSTASLRSCSSKSQSPNHSKLPVLSNGKQSTKDKNRKKEKEGKISKMGNVRVSDMLGRSPSKGNDSDSGNDSGIVTNEKKLLSPYATITKPRTPSHSSSGHGSDNSSNVSADILALQGNKCSKIHGGTSSGYESMLRDSEGTVSSSAHDESETDDSEKKKGSKKKKNSGNRRSRSAPARSSESPESSKKQSPNSQRKVNGTSSHARAESRQMAKVKEEPFEMKKYDKGDVERLQRWRLEEAEVKALEQRRDKMKEILAAKQDQIKTEIPDNKDRIIMERAGWSFDCNLLRCFTCRTRSPKNDV